ncbi:MAG: hypothetical protein QNJ57_01275 [Flavobacteriaceae bacterium]|nr:hypothetical protein [Flavobacteriaceae bacterium]
MQIIIRNIKYIIIVLILSSLVLSCKKYKLSKEDKSWQPYSNGDILVFRSDENKRDSVFIDKIESHYNPNDPLTIGKEKFEFLFVSGEITLRKPIKTKLGHIFTREKIDVLQMSLDENQSYLKFVFNRKSDTLRYPTTVMSTKDLNKKLNGNTRVKIEAKEYYDVPFDHDLKYFWWNKKFGYVRFEFKNGTYLELDKFIRKGENILAN